MTPDEVIDLLTLIQSYDRRTVGRADVAAWLLVVGDLPFSDAHEAALGHYRESREWIMPADVRSRVRAIQAARLAVTPIPAPPPELLDDEAAYRAHLRASAQAIASPDEPPRAIGGAR